MSLHTVRSERALCERITFDMLFRWFLDMTPDEACFDHSDFTNFRERLDTLDITKKFSDGVVTMALEAGLISEDRFSIDGPLLQIESGEVGSRVELPGDGRTNGRGDGAAQRGYAELAEGRSRERGLEAGRKGR